MILTMNNKDFYSTKTVFNVKLIDWKCLISDGATLIPLFQTGSTVSTN